MKPEFISLTAAALDQALDMMGGLYAEARAAHRRERARRAAEGLLANPELGGVWLIRMNGEQVEAITAGYLCITVCYSLEFDGRFALLDELYLKPEWRGQGIGSQAIRFAEEWSRARGLAAIRLEVAQANGRAFELYRRQGFKAHERRLVTKWL